MIRKRNLIIILLAGIILLLTGFGSSYFWLTRIYLPREIDANENARELVQWTERDTFIPPDDRKLDEQRLILFIHVNESLSFIFRKFRRQFEENSWRLAFDVIKMQPEWAGNKYLALKKFNLTPREYDWIVDLVIEFWIYRWKENSIVKLRELGWELNDYKPNPKKKPVNYELLSRYEEELNKILEILWPDESMKNRLTVDSV
jgi:hypothetical protein